MTKQKQSFIQRVEIRQFFVLLGTGMAMIHEFYMQVSVAHDQQRG